MTKLDKLLGEINRKHVYIQTHNFPDPDAIASAYGLQKLLELRGVRATICYKGKIDRYSTGKLVEIIGIELLNVDELEKVLSDDDEVILVDSQKGNANIIDITGDEIICIDHHPDNDLFEYRFRDIRPEIGACATMIAQYFFENNVPMDRKIATALSYGIRIVTNNLNRGVSRLDVEMLYRMYYDCDYTVISMLENSILCFEDLVAYSRAISSIEVHDDISFADTGRDCPVIADISDFMLALKEVTFSVVYSVKDGGIKLSVRSEGTALDAGKVIGRALTGIGNGGGHASMAGGFVPFDGDAQEKAALLEDIKRRFITQIQEMRSTL